MIELRLILANKPCCMPLSKRMIATFGDGCTFFVSDLTSIQSGVTHNLDIDLNFAYCEPWNENTVNED